MTNVTHPGVADDAAITADVYEAEAVKVSILRTRVVDEGAYSGIAVAATTFLDDGEPALCISMRHPDGTVLHAVLDGGELAEFINIFQPLALSVVEKCAKETRQ